MTRTTLASLIGGVALASLSIDAHAQVSGREAGFSGNLPAGVVSRSGAPGDIPGEALAYEVSGLDGATDGFRAWGHYVYGSSRLGADRNGGAIRSSGNGLVVGIERSFGPRLTLGVSLGYSRGESSSIGVRSDSDTYSGAGYLWWNPMGGLEIDALVGASGTESDIRRQVSVGGAPTSLSGNADGFGMTSLAAIGYRFRYDTALGPAYMKPFASVSYGTQDRGGYAELNGAGSGLFFPGKTFERSLLNLGAAAGVEIPLANGWTMRPEVSLAWSRHLIDPTPVVPVLDVATGAGYLLRDPEPGRDGLVVSTEVSIWQASSVQIFAGYTGEFRENLTAHQARVGLRATW